VAETVGQLVTDHLLRNPLQILADARRGSSFLYEFAWQSRLPGLGSCHALELGFVFDTGSIPEAEQLAGRGAPQELADAMHAAWVGFVTDGDPGWRPWDATHPVRIFGDGAPRTELGPRDAHLALWAADSAVREQTEEQPQDPPPSAGSARRGTEPRSVIRRLRRPGSVRRKTA
jgi:para-nitrobenzyl esterase